MRTHTTILFYTMQLIIANQWGVYDHFLLTVNPSRGGEGDIFSNLEQQNEPNKAYLVSAAPAPADGLGGPSLSLRGGGLAPGRGVESLRGRRGSGSGLGKGKCSSPSKRMLGIPGHIFLAPGTDTSVPIISELLVSLVYMISNAYVKSCFNNANTGSYSI
jgi:hypothetical protein